MTYTASTENEDVAEIFVNMLEENVKSIYKRFDKPKKMIFGAKESLDKLVENLDKNCCVNTGKFYKGKQLSLLMRKGVYPYEYASSCERFNDEQLPPKEAFYSKLSGEDISDDDYKHAHAVWEEFDMKTFKDYHNLYNVSDVLLLADVFENFRGVCMENYHLDPAWYYTRLRVLLGMLL